MSAAHLQSGTRLRASILLVVDDDVEYRETIRDVLTAAGYVVLEASDGAEALELLVAEDARQPSAIVLDVQMPRMTGPELVVALRQNDRLAWIPVILMSSGPRPAIAYRDVELTWLPKPFDVDRLLALVHAACEVERRRAENGSE
jgi:CheY-like chemotaxis protein